VSLEARPPSFSRTELGELMLPHQANILGKVFGGTILAMIDKAAATAAIRHARRVCVTAQVDRVTFRGPIEIGEVVRVVAEVTAVGRTSLEVEVGVFALDALTGIERLTNSSWVTMVAIDETGATTPVPPLALTTDEERERNRVALERMAERRQRRS
jgi:acyl-CoA hydrolase